MSDMWYTVAAETNIDGAFCFLTPVGQQPHITRYGQSAPYVSDVSLRPAVRLSSDRQIHRGRFAVPPIFWTEERIIAEIKRFHTKTGKVPSRNDEADLAFGATTVFRRFGSWNAAIIKAGLKPNSIRGKTLTLVCMNCGKTFKRGEYQAKKHKRDFCTQSCAAIYTNTHKTTGIRRSKLEKWIEKQLSTLYPGLEIRYNDKAAIDSELDIFIPSFGLAFELNGLFHYQPIYGSDKFRNIQINDLQKRQRCRKRNINLVIVDVSFIKKFNVRDATAILNIVIESIEKKRYEVSIRGKKIRYWKQLSFLKHPHENQGGDG